MDTLPAETPWWIVIAFGAVSALCAFLAAQVWPFMRQRWEQDDAQEVAERAEERAWRHGIEERRVKAQEQTAQAIEQISRTLTAMDFRIAQIERRTGLEMPGREAERGK